MENNWRTVQFFLEDYGVVELEIDRENNSLVRCNCADFNYSASCKHSKHSQKIMAENKGHYSIDVSVGVDEEEAILAMRERSLFRAFVIKYGKVLVITSPSQVNSL